MRKFIFSYTVLFLLGILLFGCKSVPKKSTLEDLYGKRFEGLSTQLPYFSSNEKTIEKIKADNKHIRSFGDVTYEKLWDVSMLVMKQKSVIVRSSREDGIIVALPYEIYIEKSDSVKIYPYFEEDVYKLADNSAKSIIKIEEQGKNLYLTQLLDEITASLQIEKKTNVNGQWSYLFD